MNFLLSLVLELFQSSALLRYRARYLGYIFVYRISWDSEIYKLDHHISGSSFTLARCSPLSKVQRQHFIEKTTENIQTSSLWQQLLICLSFVHPCPQGRYTQSFRFKLVVSYKSCMRPRLTQIQGDSNLFTDFFLR